MKTLTKQVTMKQQKVNDNGNVYKVDNGEEIGSDEEVVAVCLSCGSTPCDWMYYKDNVIEFARNNQFFVNHTDPQDPYSFLMDQFLSMMDEEKSEIKASHQEYKKKCFQHYTRLKYGRLGLGNQIKHPSCIEDYICWMFPIHDNTFVGYHSS